MSDRIEPPKPGVYRDVDYDAWEEQKMEGVI